MKINIKGNWKQTYMNQTTFIQDWIKNKSGQITPDIVDGSEITYKDLFYQFLGGENVAGIGQGRFSNNAKSKLQEKWGDIVPRLAEILKSEGKSFVEKKEKDTIVYEINKDLTQPLSKLQNMLISYCKKQKDGKDVEEHKPWAAIHAMIAALKPSIFCTIVSENNLNELYKKLNKEHKNINAEQQQEKEDTILNNEFTFIGGKAWDILQKQWKLACDKEIVNSKMSWYYKSAAIQNYYRALLQETDSEWIYKNYPWETLVAFRGEENIKELCGKLARQRNIILTGAPGTGKTYLARKIAAMLINVNEIKELNNNPQYDFVQFHPSYDYTDFVEGLRPKQVGNNVVFERKDGIFKDFCKNAAKAEKEDENAIEKRKFVFVIDEINRGEISKIFGELFFSIDPGYRGEIDKDGISNRVKTQYQNLIEDASQKIQYQNLVEDASQKVNEQRQGNSNISTNTTNDVFNEGFYVPDNVFVIGTMNDIDRSVESMDFAFRRRFAFHEVTAVDSEAMIYSAKDEDGWTPDHRQDAVDRMESLNKALTKKCDLPDQYQIGGAYFLKYKEVRFNPDSLWNEYLRGTLYEYFRGLPSKEIDDKLKILKDAYDNGTDD
jgi:5-methylcytosine-specific restriction endonuclease McrBC GTP-binding regulatory subunit McrB